MAYLCVDECGIEHIFDDEPQRTRIPKYLTRSNREYWGVWSGRDYTNEIALPHGSIQKLIGRSMSWEDEPVELKEYE